MAAYLFTAAAQLIAQKWKAKETPSITEWEIKVWPVFYFVNDALLVNYVYVYGGNIIELMWNLGMCKTVLNFLSLVVGFSFVCMHVFHYFYI